MKILMTTTVFALAAVPCFAQEAATGISNPPPAVITASPDAPAGVRTKPSAAVAYAPGSPAASQPTPFGPYVPYRSAGASARTAPRDPDADIVTSVPSRRESSDDSGIVTSMAPRRPANTSADEDAGIVTYVPSRPNEVPTGTLLATRIRETISTASTPVGTRFTAEITAPMERDGRVVIPAGSVLHGHVSVVRGGRRISGAAAIHLLPESVTLPDGTQYVVHAQVIDTSEHHVTRVNDEGTILRRDHVKGTIAAMSLTTGGAAATGAVFGGVPGAFIGAGIGAGVSTVWWLKQDRQEVVPQNTAIIFSLNVPMSVTPLTLGTN